MLFMLNRPFQDHPIYFDIPSSCSVIADLPGWFGDAWQEAPSNIARESAKPLLAIDSAQDYPLEDIVHFVYEHNNCKDGHFAFHGGAVTKGEDAYLFLASTTTGKTTLITYLTQLGYTYLNDDCFYFNMETLEVPPYTAPIHVREGGFAYLQSALPRPLPESEYRHMAIRVAPRYVIYPENRTTITTRPRAIFFIDRTDDPNVPDSCTKMNGFEAMRHLMMGALIPYQMSKEYLEFFRRLTPYCYKLVYHNAETVANHLMELIEP